MPTGPGALLAHELFDRLEEVDVQASQGVDAGQLGIGALGGEAIIADEMADDGPVLLLHMRAVILLPGAAAGEGNALADTVPIQGLVDELRAIVAVEGPQGHGQALPDFMDGSGHAMLSFAQTACSSTQLVAISTAQSVQR